MNEPLTDFAQESNRAAFGEAIRRTKSSLPKEVPLIIGTKRLHLARRLTRKNPSHLSEIVGHISLADPSHAEEALAQAEAAAGSWCRLSIPARAEIFQRAAALMRKRRFELAAWEVLEVGKSWMEADADVAEAIDTLTYYPQEILRWTQQTLVGQVPGEKNIYQHEPLGPGVVISPWNFPLAILTGMTTAALVAGNTAVLKPAEQSSIVGLHLAEILLEAGVPPGVVHFLPGIGAEVGETLVRSPRVHWIAFTGSKVVGLRILRLAAEPTEGQRHLKRVIAEMGGKNGIIVDEDADLDEAVIGTAVSAFGYQGQKCSACSRVIVLESIADRFLKRLVETTRSLPIGPAEEPGTVIGPLVDEEAFGRVRKAIEEGKRVGRLLFQGQVPDSLDGTFVGPVIFTEVPRDSFLAQEEIFGPVLAVLTARSFEEALAIANGVPYALTGGLYSRHLSHIEQAQQEFQVGNLYINRKITGAVVGRQPFGGLRLSGTGHKAGGPDYLLQFLQARTITENTLRHGFAPLEE
ncbi:MAG: L-glutamate gamma-semialdehyde dehydrogenase [Candidatus Omnitrophica bacterium]|nr:L-glutamate gamma-semialdehyde dehydrogenase [Candidatus Omnitrophota bacterium]